jgi:hypothetical protein
VLDVRPGTLHGSIVVQDEDLDYIRVVGDANIGGTALHTSMHGHIDTCTYDAELDAGDWAVYPNLRFDGSPTSRGTPVQWLSLNQVPETVEIPPDTSVEKDFYIDPAHVTGSIHLSGANTDLHSATVNANYDRTSPDTVDAYATTYTGDYELLLYEGEWDIGSREVGLQFDFDGSDPSVDYDSSYLSFTDLHQSMCGDLLSVEAGGSYVRDFSFGTALVTLHYRIAGGGEMWAPEIRSQYTKGSPSEDVYITTAVYAIGSPEHTTSGEATVTLLEGRYCLEASAYVADDSSTVFGCTWVDVKAGDVVDMDLGAPTVTILEPGGLQHLLGSSVVVKGTATGDVQIDAIEVNGEPVDFESTGNPRDDNEVGFTTTVTGLAIGENTITVVATDVDGKTSTVERTVISDNEAPTIDSFAVLPSELVKLGDLTTVTAGVSDPNQDALTTTLSWGDGTSTVSTDEAIETTHEYTGTGVYTVTLSVTDGVIVYDPEGGFVTGGGWIVSPEGAHVADESLTGKASFGFVSKYKKGADVPTGNVEFQFKLGGLNFHSEEFDWLVVAGSKAKFKGTGTINGEGNYGFMISAIDGGDDGADSFRIKIWDKDADDAVVYDNQLGDEDDDDPTTELGGGQIVVHKG